jgi:hypothetical protein
MKYILIALLMLSSVVHAEHTRNHKKVMICNTEKAIRLVHHSLVTAQSQNFVGLIDKGDCIELTDDLQYEVRMTIDRLYSYVVPTDPRLPTGLKGFWILSYQIPADDASDDTVVDLWFE